MFGTLADAIEDLEVPIDSDALVEAHRLMDRLAAKVADSVARFDTAGLWELEGALSLRQWFTGRCRMHPRAAAVSARRVTAPRVCPLTWAAWQAGEVSGGVLETVTDVVTPARQAEWLDKEAGVLEAIRPLSMIQTGRALARWGRLADAVIDRDDSTERANTLFMSSTLGERGELQGSFDSASTETIKTALRLAERRDDEGEVRVPAQRRADALVTMCAFYLDHHQRPSERRHRPHVNLMWTLADLEAGHPGVSEDGVTIPGVDLATMACDSVLSRVLLADGQVLEFGRDVYAVPPGLYRAVVVRDGGCRWPDCDRAARYCQAHHVQPWWAGGTTSIDNIALLCGRHHRKLHGAGWHAKLLPDATFELTDPQGHTRQTKPARAGPALF